MYLKQDNFKRKITICIGRISINYLLYLHCNNKHHFNWKENIVYMSGSVWVSFPPTSLSTRYIFWKFITAAFLWNCLNSGKACASKDSDLQETIKNEVVLEELQWFMTSRIIVIVTVFNDLWLFILICSMDISFLFWLLWTIRNLGAEVL